jgi:hypothetical protein
MTTAMVRVLHGSPDAPSVDIYANGQAIAQAVPFGMISPYLEVPAGPYRIQVVPEGATLEEGPVVIDAEMAFDAGTMTTVAATDALAQIAAQVISDSPAPVADEAQIRVVHLSADAPRVDIAADGSGRKDALVKRLAYPAATDYLNVPAGEYDLEIRPAGKKKTAFDIPALTLESGKSYSAIAIGSLADGTFTVLAVEDASAA